MLKRLPPYWLLYVAMISVGMGQSVIFAVLPMLGRELSLDQLSIVISSLSINYQPKELAITALSALTALTFSLVSPFWGRLSDRVGRKPIIIIGLLGYTLGVSLFSLAAWLGLKGVLTGIALYAVLLVTRLIHSLVMSASFPASSAYMVDVTPVALRAKALGRMAAFMQIGVMCGPALAYLMVYGYLLPFIVQAFITLLAGWLIFCYFPYHKPEVTTVKRAKLSFFGGSYRAFLAIALVFYVGLGMVQQTLGFYFQDILQLPGKEAAKTYALAMMFSSAAMLIAQFGVVQRFTIKPQHWIRLGIPFACLGFFILAIAGQQWMLLLGMSMFGFSMGLVGPSITASASVTVDAKDQGALAGLVGSVAGLGFVFGPLIGGVAYRMNMHLPYYLAASMLFIAAIWVLIKKMPGE